MVYYPIIEQSLVKIQNLLNVLEYITFRIFFLVFETELARDTHSDLT